MNSALIYPVNQSGPEILKLADVRVRFPVSNDWLGRPRGYAHALNGIDLQVRAGETLGIVGESGCGKSTLAQLLMGLLKPSSGELSWANGSKGEGSSNVQIVFGTRSRRSTRACRSGASSPSRCTPGACARTNRCAALPPK